MWVKEKHIFEKRLTIWFPDLPHGCLVLSLGLSDQMYLFNTGTLHITYYPVDSNAVELT